MRLFWRFPIYCVAQIIHGFVCKPVPSYKCVSRSAASCQHTVHSPLNEVLLWKGGQVSGKDVAVWVGVLLWASWGEQRLILRWEKQQLLSFQVQAGRADEWPAVPQGPWAGSHRASHWWCWRGDAGGSTAAWQQGEVFWNGNTPKEKIMRLCCRYNRHRLAILQEKRTRVAIVQYILD